MQAAVRSIAKLSRSLRPRLPTASLSRRWMAIVNVPVPGLGDSITDGTIVEINKSVGDAVSADEVILVIETDKVTVDVRSPQSGTIKGVHASEGDTVEVGAGLFDLDTDGGAPSAAQLDDKGSPSKGSQAASPPSSPAAAPSPETGSSPSPSSPSGTQASVDSGNGHEERVPSIRFRHGRANQEALKQDQGDEGKISNADNKSFENAYEARPEPPSKADMSWLDQPPMWGRRPMEQAEMDAVELGGASDWD